MRMKTEIERGCGRRTNFESNGLNYKYPICSFGNLCPQCRTLLQQMNDILEAIDKMIQTSKNSIDSYNTDYVILEELKQSIIGEKT